MNYFMVTVFVGRPKEDHNWSFSEDLDLPQQLVWNLTAPKILFQVLICFFTFQRFCTRSFLESWKREPGYGNNNLQFFYPNLSSVWWGKKMAGIFIVFLRAQVKSNFSQAATLEPKELFRVRQFPSVTTR